ncbi:MAG: FapA family protein [Chloroflexi bacterium]|nr:FapA family protein [Chloroflexota bacterium]
MAEQTQPTSESEAQSPTSIRVSGLHSSEIVEPAADEPREQRCEILVTVSPDGMSALLSLSADPPEPYPFTPTAITEALAKRCIEHGILHKNIEQLVAQRDYVTDFPVALGTPVEAGEDGRLDLLFDPSTKVHRSQSEDRVDWHEVSLFNIVAKDQPLARRVPPISGTPGKTVTGKVVEPPRVREARLHADHGTKVNADNPNELLAATNGAVRLVNERIVVENLLVVPRDVDFSVGNIDFQGNVQIGGSVMPGFHVKATGDVQVRGSVESATVESGGSVLVSQGVIGQSGHTAVAAAKDVAAALAWNAVITAGGNVTLQSEAVNCSVRSGGVVSVGVAEGKRGRIAGGEIWASKELHTTDLGAESATKTIVVVDEEGYLARALARKDRSEKIARLEQDHATIVSKVGVLLERKLSKEAEWTEAHEGVMSQLAQSASQIEEELMMLQEEVPPPPRSDRPKVVVHGTLYPGVKVSISHQTRTFSERLSHLQVVVTDDYSAILTVKL